MAFQRCIWCGKSEGLSKIGKREHVCNACGFIHTVSNAKCAAGMSDEHWAQHVEECAIRMKYPSFIRTQKMADKLNAEIKALRDSRRPAKV